MSAKVTINLYLEETRRIATIKEQCVFAYQVNLLSDSPLHVFLDGNIGILIDNTQMIFENK